MLDNNIPQIPPHHLNMEDFDNMNHEIPPAFVGPLPQGDRPETPINQGIPQITPNAPVRRGLNFDIYDDAIEQPPVPGIIAAADMANPFNTPLPQDNDPIDLAGNI